jgi:signal transduction histidine kinase
MIGFLFTLLVGRRIDRLSGTMRLVEAGDLTARVPVRNTDELGRLGSSFNTMVARMSELQRQQADRHAEELRQAEKVASLGKMAAIGLITAGIAHELNNPLNNIGITAEALVKGFETYPEREKIRMLGQVRTQVVRASAIIANLLDFTRSDSKAFGPLSVKKALESAIGLIGNELRLAGVDVRLDLPEDLPEINGSFRDLQQVFLNLFLNSVQSMPAGGTIEARATLDHGFIQIEVADTGSGIAPENVDKVFVPFFTTKEPGKGTGLGLSVSYGIIQKHRGSIAVKSELGKGTRFSIALPVAPRASGSAPGAER